MEQLYWRGNAKIIDMPFQAVPHLTSARDLWGGGSRETQLVTVFHFEEKSYRSGFKKDDAIGNVIFVQNEVIVNVLAL